MILMNEKTMDLFTKLLQKEIIIRGKGKQWRKGKLLLFKQSGFYIELILEGVKRRERFELPIPFDIESWDDDGIHYLVYKLNTLTDNKEVANKLSKLCINKNNRFYDSVLEIEEIRHEVR